MNAIVADKARTEWRRAILTTGLLLAVVLVLYRDTALAMVAIWSRSDTFAHAFLVPPIVAWLIWRQRHALALHAPRPTLGVLLPIAVAGAAWLVGDLAASNAVAQLAFTALLVLVVVATIGLRASRTIAFPLGFLFFSVPVGEFVMPQMMQWTADFTVFALQLTGIPVYREGLQFVVPSGNWSVVEACSGIRYLIASIMVGTLFAYLNYRSLRRRLVFTGISIVVPIVANWIRAYLIVLIGDISGNAAAVSADHIVYGWVFFGVVITVMFLIGARWSEPAARPSDVACADDAAPRSVGAPGLAVAVVAALLVVLPHLALSAMLAAELPGQPTLDAPRSLPGGWTLSPAAASGWTPAFSGAAVEFNRYYTNAGGTPVGLYIGYYRHQAYGNKLVSSENRAVSLHDADWSAVDHGSRTITSEGVPRVLETTLLRGGGPIATDTTRRLLVWQAYWVDGRLISNEVEAKALVAFQRLLGRGDDAAVILFYRQSDASDTDAGAPLAAFAGDTLASLSTMLARVRDPVHSSITSSTP